MAEAVDIDLATTIVPPDHKLWKLFPGEAYKFMNFFAESKVVFLDVRGLEVLDGNPKNWDRNEVLEIVSLDRWSRQNEQRTDKTERRISDSDKRTATYVEGLLTKAKKGDFILVPAPGPDGLVSVYELTSGPGAISKVDGQDGRTFNTYIGRRVRWLGGVRKRALDYAVVEMLQTPVAFFDMGNAGRTTFYEEILGNYVHDSGMVATYRVAKEDYNSRDNRIASTWMEFVDLVSDQSALEAAIANASGASIYELLDAAFLTEAQRSDLSININSPGEILMRALGLSPLIGLALFPLAANGVPYEQALEAQVHIATLGGAVDDCTAQVQSSVKTILEAMGSDRWIKACELAQKAQSAAEISTDSSIEN
ncbi:hypothetical protein [Aurantiacibacter hainanensis]|uniref:hypothetical protein n=1 Tax=Aurantiacibacter hainanensis TaxID=3076114 RepID=UPI0030C6FE42